MEQSFSEARFVARFGRVAQHSLCAYALTLWSAENEYQKREKECQRVASDLASARRLQNKSLALKRRVRHSNRKANHREITAAVAKVEELFSEARSMFDACVKLRDFAFWQLKIYERYFADEALQALRDKNFAAFKALERARDAWKQPHPLRRYLAVLDYADTRAKIVRSRFKQHGSAAVFDCRICFRYEQFRRRSTTAY
jgi:hypothetical protein